MSARFTALTARHRGSWCTLLTGKLTAAFADKESTVKEYRALLTGVPEDRCGELHDLLYHDAKRNKTYVVDRMRKGVREASLYYEVVSVNDGRALVSVRLLTGRTHQIRVQFASRGLPICGDGRYGGGSGKLMLSSVKISLIHPVTGERVEAVDETVFSSNERRE